MWCCLSRCMCVVVCLGVCEGVVWLGVCVLLFVYVCCCLSRCMCVVCLGDCVLLSV